MADDTVGLATPDTTTAQIIAYATAALSALVILFKLDISDVQQAAAITILAAVLGAFHMLSDARTRAGRAQVAAAAIKAGDDPGSILASLPNPTSRTMSGETPRVTK